MELLASGREAEVYAVDAGLVLRRFRDPGRSAGDEAALLTRLGDAGYPVPRVASWDGPGLVLERIAGPRLSDAMTAGTTPVGDGALLLAGLHDRLHALPWEDGTLLHLDLHPENVLLGPAGPVVIDWTNARPGPAGLDVAMSGLILMQVAEAEPAYAELLEAFVSDFIARVADGPLEHVDAAVALRRLDPHLSASEQRQLDAAGARLRAAC